MGAFGSRGDGTASALREPAAPVTIDPAAVNDVDLFLECVRAAFRELLRDRTPVYVVHT
jgi:hypothetical protein